MKIAVAGKKRRRGEPLEQARCCARAELFGGPTGGAIGFVGASAEVSDEFIPPVVREREVEIGGRHET